MHHELHLYREPFNKIYSGRKTIELRMNDRKRQEIQVGDTICFILADNPVIKMDVKVTALHKFPTFKELHEELPLTKCGYESDHMPEGTYHDMEKYPGYSLENQKKLGVLGIEFEEIPWHKPYRDPFRMEPFLEEFGKLLMEFWNRHPDYRFGQILTNFQYSSLQQKGIKDFYYIEDEDFLPLWEQFVKQDGRS